MYKEMWDRKFLETGYLLRKKLAALSVLPILNMVLAIHYFGLTFSAYYFAYFKNLFSLLL